MEATVKERVFESKEVKKHIEKFRNKLKKKNIVIRTNYKNKHYQYESSVRINIKHKLHPLYIGEYFVYINIISNHLLSASINSINYWNNHPNPEIEPRNWISELINCISDIAKELNSSAILFELGNSVAEAIDGDVSSDFSLKQHKDISVLLPSYNADKRPYFMDLVPGYVERRISFDSIIDMKLDAQNKNSNFFEWSKSLHFSDFNTDRDINQYQYYYQGFNGIFKIYYGKDTKIYSDVLSINRIVTNKEELLKVIDYILEESLLKTKMINLIHPPKRYFTRMIIENLGDTHYIDKEIINELFDTISNYINPEDIELGSKDKNIHNFKLLNAYQLRGSNVTKFMIFTIFNKYVVINKELGSCDLFLELDKAKETYQNIIQDYLTKEYKSELERITETIKNIND